MRIFFNHIRGFGKVSDLEVIVNCAYGILEDYVIGWAEEIQNKRLT